MIQDLENHIFHNEYHPVPPKKTDCILYYEKHAALVHTSHDMLTFPSFGDVEAAVPDIYEHYLYLFSIDETRYYLIPSFCPEWAPGFAMEDVSVFRTLGPRKHAFALITGFHLFTWYQTHRFCGACGHENIHDKKERMMLCPACGNTQYPRISPAVIVAVRNGEKLLLSKYAGRNHTRYALIAGFAEIGETLEETVKREVMEEVGLKVKNIHYYKSQPWALSGSLLSGFYCDLDGDDQITLDETELAVAEWFERKEIPYEDYDVNLTREMMLQFKKGLDT